MSTIQVSRIASLLLPVFRRSIAPLARNVRNVSVRSTTTVNQYPCKPRVRPSSLAKYSTIASLDNVQYEKICSDTLESLCDYFEEIVEKDDHLKTSDISYGDGVLTVNFGSNYGSYVINRQSPNKQIWLSSPTSGPKRYDYVGDPETDKGKWIYKHTGESLHELLQKEIKNIVKVDIDFFKLPYSKVQ